ncbi:alanine racemase [candidate division KSB1 bacterium]
MQMKAPERLSYAEIDLAAFRWNFTQIQKPARIAAVVKANAYGHGIGEVSRESLNLGAACLCVAFVQEGLYLRAEGFECPVLVFIPPGQDEIEAAVEHDLELTPDSYEKARQISETAQTLNRKALIQVNIDTGMHRTGVHWEHAAEELNKMYELPHVEIKGVYTHFATADWADLNFSSEQLRRFRSVLEKLLFDVQSTHAANSGAILQAGDAYFDMVRPGISLYGHYPSQYCRRTLKLRPVMTLKSYVMHLREYRAKERFSYSLTYCIEKDTVIATVPIGYADGVNRLLSNSGSVLIRGREFPVVAVVSMDSILVDVGEGSGITEGDEVVLLGKQGAGEIKMQSWCEKLQSIPYEVTCNISDRMPRRYVNGSV